VDLITYAFDQGLGYEGERLRSIKSMVLTGFIFPKLGNIPNLGKDGCNIEGAQ
jgi:hypothetical protein